jgi:hypothetical protein
LENLGLFGWGFYERNLAKIVEDLFETIFVGVSSQKLWRIYLKLFLWGFPHKN